LLLACHSERSRGISLRRAGFQPAVFAFTVTVTQEVPASSPTATNG
jgi:hypothetical protein